MQQMYLCPKCNSPTTYGIRFCINCGAPLNWYPQQQVQPQLNYQQQYECFWLPFVNAMYEVFPRYNSLLCINEYCNLAFFILPDILLSMALSKIIYDNPISNIAIIQKIGNNRDESYLAPLILKENQLKSFEKLTDLFKKGKLKNEVSDCSWSKLIAEIKNDSSRHFNYPQILQTLERAYVYGRYNLTEPDDENISSSNKVPVYIYTCQGNRLNFDSNKFLRVQTLCDLTSLSKEAQEDIHNLIIKLPNIEGWQKDGKLLSLTELIGRVEFELSLNSDEAKPQLTSIVLDPDKSYITFEPNRTLRVTPKGKEAVNNIQAPNSCFSIHNWGEPNIIQIILYAMQPILKPISSITIIKDELGIHTLPTYLFRYILSANFKGINAYTFIDTIPANDIPEIEWQAISKNVYGNWWQTDRNTRKILWLSIQNLISNELNRLEEQIISVIPMGNDAIQVSIAQGNMAEGAPYAFAIVMDNLEINAIPIFQSLIFRKGKNGSYKTTKSLHTKNYTISRRGERIDYQLTSHTNYRPIFKDVEFYATKNWLKEQGESLTTLYCCSPFYKAIIQNHQFNPSSLLNLGNSQIGY